MTTVRADFSVAVRSEVDGKMYFNLMVFLQMDCCDLATGQLKPDKRPWVIIVIIIIITMIIIILY